MPRYGCVPMTRKLDITNCCLNPDPRYVGSRSICHARTAPKINSAASTPPMTDNRFARENLLRADAEREQHARRGRDDGRQREHDRQRSRERRPPPEQLHRRPDECEAFKNAREVADAGRVAVPEIVQSNGLEIDP